MPHTSPTYCRRLWAARVLTVVGLLQCFLCADAAIGKLLAAEVAVDSDTPYELKVDGATARWIEVRCGGGERRKGSHPGEDSRAGWRLELADSLGNRLWDVEFSGRVYAEIYGAKETAQSVKLSTGEKFRLEKVGRFTSVALVALGDGRYEVWAGDRKLKFLTVAEIPGEIDCITVSTDGRIRDGSVVVKAVNIESRPEPKFVSSGLTADDVAAMAGGKDAIAGIYEYFDSDVTLSHCRIGGNYRLGVVPDGEGGYTLIYISGAERNRDAWSEGMVKGRLKPTAFKDHFDLEWVDALGNPDLTELWGRLNGAVLELYFPTLRSSMRFRRRE